MSELATRLIYTYSAQSVLALVMCALFFNFAKKFSRPFLNWWGVSWIFYSIQFFSSIAITAYPVGSSSVWSFLILFASYAQVFYLLYGVLVLVRDKRLSRFQIIGVIIVGLLSFLSFILYHNNPDGSSMRYLIRVGIKSWIVGAGFFYIAYVIFRSEAFNKGFTKLFLIFAFVVYAAQQVWYGVIVYLNTIGMTTSFPISTFGIFDLFVIAVVAVGMIMWLLENEHQELKQTNQQLDSFLYRTSHDLRAPISSLLGLTNLGKLESKEDTAQEYFRLIEGRIQKLDIIFQDILNYSKSANLPINTRQIDFTKFVNEVYEKVQYVSSFRDIKFEVKTHGDKYINTDRVQLEIILGNILSNALKYLDKSKAEHCVEVELTTKGTSEMIILIKDNGIGIDKDNLERIFEMFYRATTTGEGSGLGLFIAYEAAKKIDGRIEVSSELEIGTTFKLILPR